MIVTSNHTRAEFEQKTKQPVSVITNGYDSHRIQRPEKDDKFSISHIGSLLSERNPVGLWQALSELTKEHKELAEHLQLNLIGVVSDEVVRSIQDHGLSDHLNVLGYLDHDEAIKAQMTAQVLLLIEIDSEDTKAIIPGKLFEYMVSQTPILAVGPKDSDVETIIRSTKTGTYYNYQQAKEIKSQILSYFEAYKSGTLKVSALGLQQYSRKALTEALSKIVSQY